MQAPITSATSNRGNTILRITLLGHPDIASLLAMNLLVQQLPQHRFSVLMSSGEFSSGKPLADELESLEATEADYGRRFLAGELGVAPAAPLRTTLEPALDKPNAPEGLDRLASTEPDLIVSIRYHRILKSDAIRMPGLGVLNLHSGLLPEYRGVMATFWAMLNGESSYGTTIHRIVDGTIDTGPAFVRHECPLDLSQSYLSNVVSLYPQACRALAGLIDTLEHGGAAECRPGGEGRYFSVPTEADFTRFAERELTLTDERDEQRIRMCAKLDVN